MPGVPSDVVIRGTIRPGSVYYFHHEDFLHSTDPHYFAVINIDPTVEQVILLVCAFSGKFKVFQRRANLPPQTLIQVTPSQYSGFIYPSIFDCNDVYTENLENLIRRLGNAQLKLKPELDMQIVEQLRKGVLASPLIEGWKQTQLRTSQSG